MDTQKPDTLIFVATTAELEQLREAAKVRALPFEKLKNPPDRPGTVYRMGAVGPHVVEAVKTEIGSFGPGGSAAQAVLFQKATMATTLLQVGMAFGVDRSVQKHGDVLVSEAMFPYEQSSIVDADHGLWRHDWTETKSATANSIALRMLKEEGKRRRDNSSCKVFFGTMISGSSRIAGCNFLREVMKNVRNVVGGEMEAIGLVSASSRPLWAVVKGISDFADRLRSQDAKQHRDLACRNAAEFALDALRNDGPASTEPRDPS